jgi:putative transcriptional regulator
MGQLSPRDYLKGQFLIAMPSLADPNFNRTVTCISEHTADGAVGVIINRVHPSLVAEIIFEELEINFSPQQGSLPLHLGGPVHVGEIFILHGPPFGWEGTLMVTPTVAMSNTKDILAAIAQGRGPREFILALGCAGWGPDQLEFEIKANAWLTYPIAEDIMFGHPVEARWDEAVRRMGIDPLLLSETSGNA